MDSVNWGLAAVKEQHVVLSLRQSRKKHHPGRLTKKKSSKREK